MPACWDIFRLCWKALWPIPNSVYPSCRYRSKQAEVGGLDSKGGSAALQNALEDGSATPCEAFEERLASIWGEALSTSVLSTDEFPIQSNTSCLDELVRDGESGMLVHPEDPEAVAAALRRAVTDDELVDRAAEINARIAAEYLDQSVVRPQVVKMYEKIAARHT